MEDSTADDEDGEEAEKKSEQAEDDDSLPNHDNNIDNLLERFDRNRLSRSHVETRKNDPTSSDLQAAKESLKPVSKDTNDIVDEPVNDLGAKEEFAHNNFWRQPDLHELDDELLKEYE